MGPSSVIKVEIPADRMSRLADRFVGSQIDLLVFDAAPQPLDEHVVSPCTLAVHADGDAVAGEQAGEGRTGELRALISVEDAGLAVTGQSSLQSLDAEGRLHRDRQPPGQNPAGRPIQDDSEIDEATRHGDVGDVHRPDLVRPRDLHTAQQIWIDLVARFRLRRARTAIERLY